MILGYSNTDICEGTFFVDFLTLFLRIFLLAPPYMVFIEVGLLLDGFYLVIFLSLVEIFLFPVGLGLGFFAAVFLFVIFNTD